MHVCACTYIYCVFGKDAVVFSLGPCKHLSIRGGSRSDLNTQIRPGLMGAPGPYTETLSVLPDERATPGDGRGVEGVPRAEPAHSLFSSPLSQYAL